MFTTPLVKVKKEFSLVPFGFQGYSSQSTTHALVYILQFIILKHKPQASVFYIFRVFSNVQSVLSKSNSWLRLLHLLYDIDFACCE